MFTGRCAILLFLSSLGLGCGANGLLKTMDEYHFTAISPPQTNWAIGSVVEVKANEPYAPVLRCTPGDADASTDLIRIDSAAPEVSNKHEEKFDLSLGVSAPAKVKAELAAKNAVSYSVVATGNSIVRVPIDPYVVKVFPKIRDTYGGHWGPPIEAQELFYLYELWFASKLEYKFYDSSGVSVKLEVPVKSVDPKLEAEWSSSGEGSLLYDAGGDPKKLICLGYKKRPIVMKAGGGIEAMASRLAPGGNQARIEKLPKKAP